MKLADLQTFVDITDAGGLTAAAHRRGVTQPAISRTLRDIETRVQAQLLKRTGRGIELTPAGEEFLRFSRDTLERYSETKRRIIDTAKTLPRELRLSVPLRLGGLLIPGLYRAFNEMMPDTTVYVFEESAQRAGELLAKDQLDAALTYRASEKPDRDFVPLYSERLFAVGNARMLGSANTPIAGAAVSNLPLLLPSRGQYRDLIQSSFRAARLDLRIVRELETAEGLLAFAIEGEGVAILPMSNMYQEVTRNDVVARLISNPGVTRSVGVQLNSGIPKNAASVVLSVIRHAAQDAADDAAWVTRRQASHSVES